MHIRSTTVLTVRHNGVTVMAADGQVTVGDTVMKSNARKVRKIYDDQVMVGFAGATADAFTLFEHFEKRLSEYKGDITRTSVEMAKDWRTDRALRRLEALMLAADNSRSLLISGDGNVIEPQEGVIAIGSGGNFAYAAALAMLDNKKLDARLIAERAMKIAARICIYTNDTFIFEQLDDSKKEKKNNGKK